LYLLSKYRTQLEKSETPARDIFSQYPNIGINDSGQVAGMSVKNPTEYHAFVKSPGQPMIDLTPDEKLSCAVDIKNDGAVVGNIALCAYEWYPNNSGWYDQALIGWDNNVTYVASKINDPGSVVINHNWIATKSNDLITGLMRTAIQAICASYHINYDASNLHLYLTGTYSYNASFVKVFDRVWWQYQSNHTYGHSFDGGRNPCGFGINNAGIVVGYELYLDDTNKTSFPTACLWYPSSLGSGSLPVHLADFGKGFSYARSINNFNKVAGYALTPDGPYHACLWPEVGQIQDLGAVYGDSHAMAINDDDWVVGQYGFNTAGNPFADARAFLWTPNGGMQDLTDSVSNLYYGMTLKYALAINKDGQIAGYDNLGRPFRLIPDRTPPTGNITINDGAGYSNSRTVFLYFPSSDPEVAPGIPGSGGWDVRFSDHQEEGADKWTDWTTIVGGRRYWIFNSDGPHNVKAQFRDDAGNLSKIVQDNIIVDTIPPTATLRLNNGETYTNNPNATLYLNPQDASGVTQVHFTQNVKFSPAFNQWIYTWGFYEPYNPAESTRSQPLEEGLNYIYAQFKDASGLESNVARAEIILDTAPPAVWRFKINHGEACTKSGDVTLNIVGMDFNSGMAQMRFSDHPLLNPSTHQLVDIWTTWEPYTSIKPWTFTLTGDGPKYVKVQLLDAAGNPSVVSQADIVLDTTAPSDGTLTATAGIWSLTLNGAGFTDAGSGIRYYRVYSGASNFPPVGLSPKFATMNSIMPMTLAGLKPATTYYLRVCAVDQLGHSFPGATLKVKTKGVPLPFLPVLLGD
jgi:probable HAF family extracellular repeat protein